MQCKLLETELCSFCGDCKETIPHLFFECQYVRSLLYNFIDLVSYKLNFDIPKTCDTFLFCFISEHNLSGVINLCLLIIRYYVHICRMKKSKPVFKSAIESIKFYRNIEMYSLYLYPAAKAHQIKLKWESISQLLY